MEAVQVAEDRAGRRRDDSNFCRWRLRDGKKDGPTGESDESWKYIGAPFATGLSKKPHTLRLLAEHAFERLSTRVLATASGEREREKTANTNPSVII